MAIIQVNLDKPVAPSVALTGRWVAIMYNSMYSHPLISSTVAKSFGVVFTGRMPLLKTYLFR